MCGHLMNKKNTSKKTVKKKKKKVQKKEYKLNYKQNKFAECYKGSGIEAAKEAGYKGTDNALMVSACRLLRNPKIQEIIKERQEKEASERNVTRQEKLEILSEFIRDNSALKITVKDGIEEIIPNIKHIDRIKAVELHSKMNGDLVLKHELNMGVSLKEGLKEIASHLKSHPEEEKKMLNELEDKE